MRRLASAILSRTGSPGSPRGKIASSRIFAFGKIPAHLEHDRAHALGDFRTRVPAAVVRADHHHDRLGLKALSFAVPEPPQHALRRVAGDGEIRRPDGAEVLLEHRLVGVALHPPVGDRVAVQQQIDVPLLGQRDEPLVARALPLHRLRKGGGDVTPRWLQQQQRFEFLQERFGRRRVAVDELPDGAVDLLQLGRCRARNGNFRRHRRRRTDDDRHGHEATAARPRWRSRRRADLPGRLRRCGGSCRRRRLREREPSPHHGGHGR